MKRLLYILILLPFVIKGQIKDSSGKLIKFTSDDCVPTSGLLQNLGTLNDTAWLDLSGNNNHIDLVESNAFAFNGTDNYIDTQSKVTGRTPVNFYSLFEYEATSGLRCFFGSGAYLPTATKGIMFYVNNNEVSLLISDGVDRQYIPTSSILSDETIYELEADWSGLKGDSITVTINGSSEKYFSTVDWTGDSFSNLFVGSYTPTVGYVLATYMHAKYTTNNNTERNIPFQVGEKNSVWCVNTETELTIEGAVIASNWVLKDVYHFNIKYGFTIDGLSKVPASFLNIGLDVSGNTLSNPPIGNGHNGAETKMEQINDLSSYDISDFWYTASTPNKVSYSGLVSNTDDYLFAKLSTNSAKRLLFYNSSQSSNIVSAIEQCYLGNVKYLIKQ